MNTEDGGEFEYEIVVNRYNSVGVFRRYKDHRRGASDACGLRFWALVRPQTGSQTVARALERAIASYTDAPITIHGRC